MKHRALVQKELDTGIGRSIVWGVSAWASPKMIIPKLTQPGEPPWRRLHLDDRTLNHLLPPVAKPKQKLWGF